MLDLLAPLGRPPLDTFSPTQMVRTADPMPAGVWEIDGGAAVSLSTGLPLPFAGIRYGVATATDFSLSIPGPKGLVRPLAAVSFAPIPALWALNVNLDSVPTGQAVPPISAGTVFQIGLPWATPRLGFRARLDEGPTIGTPRYRANVGLETRIVRGVDLGADLDWGLSEPSFITLGTRIRLVGNLGLGVLVNAPVSLGPPVSIGAFTAMRF